MMNKFELISVAYRARLLLRTEAEHRQAMGVSYETVANHRDSEREMEMYFGALARAVDDEADFSVEGMIEAYAEASRLYRSLDWGERRQMASRRRFCRMLFRLYATAGRELTGDEIARFKVKDDDERLLRVFFPDGAGERPAADVLMVALFAFGVVRPYAEGARGHEVSDRETAESLGRLRGLIEVLRGDMPRLGSTEKPLVFDEWLNEIENVKLRMENGELGLDEWTPLRMYSALVDISRACRALVDAERLRQANEGLCGLHLYGIWVDDADGGERRFWIFPDNSLLAFCYEYDGYVWRLRPYDFRVRQVWDDDSRGSFLLVSPAGNLGYSLDSSRVIAAEEMARGLIDGAEDEATGEIVRLEFVEDVLPFPGWMDWRALDQLDAADPRHARLRGLLAGLYDEQSPLSLFLANEAAELTDAYNGLVGRDGKYLYVYDWRPRRCVVREAEKGVFTYEVAPGEAVPSGALFELEVSAEHPLYAIPQGIRRQGGVRDLDRLAEVMTDADNVSQAYVVRSRGQGGARLLFPDYGLTIELDMSVLGPAGVIKFTGQPLKF